MAYSIYGKLLFLALLKATLFRSGRGISCELDLFPHYLNCCTAVTNRGELLDDVPKRDIAFIFDTFANNIIHLNCNDLELHQEDTVEIVTYNTRRTYNSSFDLYANLIYMIFKTPSGKGKYNCTATIEEKDRGFHVDKNCSCGEDYDAEMWERGQNIVTGQEQNGMTKGYMNAYSLVDYLTSSLSNGTTAYCRATIVSQNIAVTSAFCLEDREVSDPNYIQVNPMDGNDTYNLEDWRIVKMISHPNYTGSDDCNIAVVKFNSPKDYKLKFACLPINMHASIYSRWFLALGWGTARERPYQEIIHVQDCLAVHNGTEMEKDHFLCMTTRNGSNVCGVESGGPIFYGLPNSRHVYLMGIIGRGANCDRVQLTMHTNVVYYLDWLSTVLNEEAQTVCVK